jgi:acetyltransferase-like isoleucine patch superfamily enzyme
MFKGFRKLKDILFKDFYTPIAKLVFMLNGVEFGKKLHVNGLLKVQVTRRGLMTIGQGLRLNSGHSFNVIGRQQKCIFWVEGKLVIKNNVGISSTAIICNHEVIIGNNVIIGGNTVIYDSDFHSLDASIRNSINLDRAHARKGSVIIKDNVFIGAHSTILKGVTIGNNSIIGACSVVTKNIPANQIWAGNPARFIKVL